MTDPKIAEDPNGSLANAEFFDLGKDGLSPEHSTSATAAHDRVKAWEGETVLVHPDKRGKAPSFLTGSIILLNSTVGSGVLSMPYAIAHLGLVFGTFFIVFIALCNYLSMRLLGAVASRCLASSMFFPINRSASTTPALPHHGEPSLNDLIKTDGSEQDRASVGTASIPSSPRSSLDLVRPTALPSHEDSSSSIAGGASTAQQQPQHEHAGAVAQTTPAAGVTPSTSTDPLNPAPSPAPSPNAMSLANAARPRVTFPWVSKQVAPWSSYLLDVGIIFMCFGGVVSYFIVISDTAITIVNNLSGATADAVSGSLSDSLLSLSSSEPSVSTTLRVLRSRYFWIGLIFCIAAPLVFFKHIDPLRYLGYINLFCVSYLMVMMVAYLGLHIDDVRAHNDLKLFPYDTSAISTLTIVVFGFAGQINYYAVYDEIREPREKNAGRSAVLAMGIAGIIYCIIGIPGAFVGGLKVPSNIMLTFPAGEWFVIVGRFAICINVSTCIPLVFHPLRICIEGLVEDIANKCGKKTSEPVRRCCVAAIVLLLALAVAMSFKKLDVVLSLAGSMGGSTVALILPGFLYFKAFPEKRKSISGIFALFILAMGIFFFVVGVIVTLINA